MRVAVIYHCEQTTARVDDALTKAGTDVSRHYLHRGDKLPLGESFDRVIVLGGEMGAYEDELHSWLAPEKLWLSDLVAAEVGVLGICLGSQLLAAALGGTAYPAPKPEAGLIKLQVTESGRGDPTFARFGEWVFSLHQDTFGLPPGSTLLASSDHFPQAFRCGSALAIQFHPDADLDLAKRWGKEEWSLLPAAGVDYDAYCHDLETADAALDENSRAFFEAWLAE